MKNITHTDHDLRAAKGLGVDTKELDSLRKKYDAALALYCDAVAKAAAKVISERLEAASQSLSESEVSMLRTSLETRFISEEANEAFMKKK